MWQRIKNYFLRHTQVGLNSLGQLSRAPLASMMTCFVIGITLALPTALFVLLKNAEGMSHHLKQSMQITLYLKKDTNQAQVSALKKTLENDMKTGEIEVISPSQGLKELRQQDGLEDIVNELPFNPLPWAIVIVPQTSYKTPDALEKLTEKLQKLPQVESIQLDTTWVKRLETLIELGHRAVYALAAFLGVAVFLIINNAIRSATQNNRKEIEIIKLIGGTYSFIRRPFLYAGAIYGLLGGIIAWQLVDFFIIILKSPFYRLTSLYNSQFQLISIGLTDTSILLLISITLGLAAAWLAVTRHLKNC